MAEVKKYAQTENNIFLVTGHSRGAAVANIVAEELTDNDDYKGLSTANHIFGYTFACPAVRVFSKEELNKQYVKNLRNIRNYNNPGDAIPELPLKTWEYGRYGETIELTKEMAYLEILNLRYNELLGKKYDGLKDSDSFVQAMEVLVDSEDVSSFNTDRNKFVFDLSSLVLIMGEKKISRDLSIELVAQVLWENKAVVNPVTLSRIKERIYIYLETAVIMQGIDTVTKPEATEFVLLKGRVEKAITDTQFWATEEKTAEEQFDEWLGENSDFADEIYTETGIQINNHDNLYEARNTLEEMIGESNKVFDLFERVAYLFDANSGHGLGAIGDAHRTETYIYWINAMYYGNEGWMNYSSEVNPILVDNGISGTIGVSCFENSTAPASFEGKIEYIATKAFYNWKREGAVVTLTGDAPVIGDVAFFGSRIEELEIKSSDIKLGEMCFANTTELKKVKIPIDVSYERYSGNSYSSENGCFYNTGVEEIEYTVGLSGVMPDRVTDSHKSENYFDTTLEAGSKNNLKKVTFEEGITYIGDNAFSSNPNLDDVSMVNSIKEIGNSAFSGTSLSNFNMPTSLVYIGNNAFSNSGISKALLPDGVEEIGYYAFDGSSIEELEIKSSDVDLGAQCFSNTTNLKKVTIPVDVHYSSYYCGPNSGLENGYFYNTGVEEIVYTPGKTGVMPDRVTTRKTGSYYSNENYYQGTLEAGSGEKLRRVTFSDGIKRVGAHSFRYDGQLNEIVMSDGIQAIGDYAFYSTKFPKIKLPSGLEEIGEYAFCNSAIEKIEIPTAVKRIGNYAFNMCKNLKGKVTLASNELSVGSYAFDGSSIEELEIKSSDVDLGAQCFSNTTNLKKVTIPVDVHYSSYYCGPNSGLENGYFYNTGVEEIVYTPGKTGVMPDRVTTRKTGSYYSNENYYQGTLEAGSGEKLRRVTFSDGIKKVGAYAFYSDNNLERIYVYSEDIYFEKNALKDKKYIFWGKNGSDIEELCQQKDYAFIDVNGGYAIVDSSSLSIDGNIGLNLYLQISGILTNDKDAYLLLDNQKISIDTLPSAFYGDQRLFKVSVSKNAKMIQDDVEISVYNGNDEKQSIVSLWIIKHL